MSRSAQLFARAQQHIPGGVNSPVRAFKSVGGTPVFIERADGAYLFDVDGKAYIDYVGSWGPMILGHNAPEVREAVLDAVQRGLSFGAPTELEIQMAERICGLMPSIESVRMVSSGTEATMSALRLARAFTGRDKILKFEGCYHGHGDSLLVKAGSGALTLGIPTSPGVPAALAEHTLTASYNRLDQVEALFERYGAQIACIIVEPVAGNMNLVAPLPEFLPGLRALCDHYGALLIFDEVMTGFRVALGGAQQRYQVRPDLTTLGKIIGAGLPVGAFGGRADIMQQVAPAGPVYQAGTLSGNPVAMSAGLAMLKQIERPGFHAELEATTARFCQGLEQRAQQAGIAFKAKHVGAMFGLFFTDADRIDYFEQVQACDIGRFCQFLHGMLAEGVYLAPSAFEAGFISRAHGPAEIDQSLAAASRVFQQLTQGKPHD